MTNKKPSEAGGKLSLPEATSKTVVLLLYYENITEKFGRLIKVPDSHSEGLSGSKLVRRPTALRFLQFHSVT
jgi:hypothetical protein